MPRPRFWIRWRHRLRRYPKLMWLLARCRNQAAHLWLAVFRLALPSGVELGPAKGWFSIYTLLRHDAVRGRVVLEEQRAPNSAAHSLRRLAPLGQEKHYPWPIFWSCHAEARLVGPTLLLMDDRKRVAMESGFGLGSLQDDPGYRQFRRPPATRLEGNWTSIVSRWSSGFYHWFMDALPRLALLEEWPADTRVIVPPGLLPYQMETLRWLGLEERHRPTSEQHLIIEHYYFGSPTMMTGLFDPYAVKFLRDAFGGRGDPDYDSPKKFYVRRVDAARGVVNDDEVTRFFREQGWHIVDTQQLTMARQIQLFSNAERICAVHGAALTNLLWCRPGTQVLEIVADNFLNGVYEGIAEAIGLEYQFMICRGDAEFRARVDLSELRERLG